MVNIVIFKDVTKKSFTIGWNDIAKAFVFIVCVVGDGS